MVVTNNIIIERVQMDDIDPDLKYCLTCNDEYRADMTHCAICKKELVTGAQKIAKKSQRRPLTSKSDVTIDGPLVGIQKGPLRDMKNLQSLLRQEGIPAIIAGDGAECQKGCCGPEVILQVSEEDLEDTQFFLAKEFQRNTALASHDITNSHLVVDMNAKKATCPACGYEFVPTSPECPDCGLVLA